MVCVGLLLQVEGTVSGPAAVVRVGDTDPGQDLDLETLHLASLFVSLVDEAQKVEQTVHEEVLEVVHRRNAGFSGFGQKDFGRKDDVTELRWLAGCSHLGRGKRQDIGRLVLAAKLPVQSANDISGAQRNTGSRRGKTRCRVALERGSRPLHGAVYLLKRAPIPRVMNNFQMQS